jgi:ribosomal protein S27E
MDFLTFGLISSAIAGIGTAAVLWFTDPSTGRQREALEIRVFNLLALVRARFQAWRRQKQEEQRRRHVHKFSKVDVDAKCPGCGHFSGTIRFSAEQRVVVHRCNICGAEWAEAPIVNADDWAPKPDQLQALQAMPPEMRAKWMEFVQAARVEAA